jgi:hypothetical protein
MVMGIALGSALLAGCKSTGNIGGQESGTEDAINGMEMGPEDAADERTSIEDSAIEATDSQDSAPSEIMPGPDHQLCEMICETDSAIPCSDRRPDCVPLCESEIGQDRCAPTLRARIACFVAAGPSGSVCMEPIGTVRKPGVCQAEVNADEACQDGDGGT